VCFVSFVDQKAVLGFSINTCQPSDCFVVFHDRSQISKGVAP
jgi:hypothetical protein